MTIAIDLALALCVLLTLLGGLKNGFFRELFSLAGLGAGLLIGLRLTTPILDRAPAVLHQSGFAWAVLFTLLFLTVYALASIVGHALGAAWEGKEPSGASRFAGLVLGGVRGYLLAIFLAGVIVMIAPSGSSIAGNSRVLPHLGSGVRWGATSVLPAPARDRLLRRWDRLPFGRAAGRPVKDDQSV